jgi:hypothetical protein
MSSSAPPPLQQLSRLDRASSEFPQQLDNVLRGQEYKQCVLNLQGDDLTWLVNYLDEVCRPVDPPPGTRLLNCPVGSGGS